MLCVTSVAVGRRAPPGSLDKVRIGRLAVGRQGVWSELGEQARVNTVVLVQETAQGGENEARCPPKKRLAHLKCISNSPSRKPRILSRCYSLHSRRNKGKAVTAASPKSLQIQTLLTPHHLCLELG